MGFERGWNTTGKERFCVTLLSDLVTARPGCAVGTDKTKVYYTDEEKLQI